MAGANVEINNADVATEQLDEAFAAIGGSGNSAGDGSGGAAEGSAGSATGAAAAAGTAGRAIAAAADQAATGWAAVRDELARYADDAVNWGKGLGTALSGAFRTAEDALAGFVAGGRIDLKAFADSHMADITRIAVRSAICSAAVRCSRAFFTTAGSSANRPRSAWCRPWPSPAPHACTPAVWSASARAIERARRNL